jgi:DHA2 family methylenomycin A resistance protein-like MFS transporter
VGFVISNVASARILNAFGTWKPILAGLGIFALGFAGLFILGEHTPYWQMFLPFLMMSGGMGLAVPAMINGILSSVDKKLSGTASALLTTTRQTAGAIGVAVIGIMATGGSTEIIAGISRAAATSICLILIAIIAIARLYRKSVV